MEVDGIEEKVCFPARPQLRGEGTGVLADCSLGCWHWKGWTKPLSDTVKKSRATAQWTVKRSEDESLGPKRGPCQGPLAGRTAVAAGLGSVTWATGRQ